MSKKIEYLSPLRESNIDPEDWSYLNKAKFDVIDEKRLQELNSPWNRRFGKERYNKLDSKLRSRNLRRWGYNA